MRHAEPPGRGETENGALPPRPSFVMHVALKLLPEGERGAVLSELRELWEKRVERDGAVRARRWYARQLRGYPLRLLRARVREGGMARSAAGPGSGGGFGGGVAGDARHAVRAWMKSPVLASTIVLTVGLGLGASTAMFAVVRVVLMDPLPYEDGDRMVWIYHAVRENRWPLSVADFQAIEAQQTHFDGVAAHTSWERTLTSGGVVQRVRVRGVTTGWFDLAGIRALHGRTFVAADGEPGTPRTAVVSFGFWQRQLGADETAVGRVIRLDELDYTVIGILPREVGPVEERYDVFPALQFAPPTRRGPFFLQVVGKVRDGTDPRVAAEELRAINKRIFPIWAAGFTDPVSTWGVMPFAEFVVGRFRTMLLVLLGAVTMVLLVASTNAAGLLTARTTQRRTELATRAALGASRLHLVRLLVTESTLLALGGATLGLALAAVALRVIRGAGPDLLPRAGYVSLDGPTLGIAALLTCASVIVFGLIPALQLIGAGSRLAQTLRAGGRTMTGGASAHGVRRMLVATQFAIAVPLLAGAALLMNSFMRLQRVDPGFDGHNLLTLRVSRAAVNDTTGADEVFWQQLLERVGALPGVAAVGLNTSRPPREADNINNFDPLDRPTPAGEAEPGAVWLIASSGYFDALGVRLVSGRIFDGRDGPDLGTTSALVDRSWANNVYPGEDPIGKQLYEGGCKAPECTLVNIIGVVEDVRYLGLDDRQQGAAVGTVYVPHSQWPSPGFFLYVRSSGDPQRLVGSIRTIVQQLDPRVPLTQIATGEALIDQALATPRNLAGVVVGFAAVALFLAMIGIYGVMSYFVHEHRKDIGIRLALGGKPREVLALILGRGMKPVLLGTFVGFGIAFGVTRYITRLLFDVAPRDPTTLALVALAMLATAIAACWLPARYAARLDPAQVLRHD